MDENEELAGDPLALSRLDVISCGLGGAVLLGLVFSIVRHETPVNVSAAPFILVEWRVEKCSKAGVRPLVNVVVTPPPESSSPPIDLPIEEFDLRTGLLKDERIRQHTDALIFQKGDFQLMGFSRFGDESGLLTTAGDEVRDDNASSTPVFRLRIANPEPGPWRFQIRYQNNQNARELSDDQARNEIQVRTRAYTREERGAIEQNDGKWVPFGEVDSGVQVKITPSSGSRN